jgi:phosphomannomutase|tara:strand:- start:1950 stop:3308 length:1359 start_codon:yes stop_codon:yes gene_type:complete
MFKEITCFKAYDIRGRVPEQLNTDVAYRIGRAFAEVVKPKNVVVGHDIRLTSPELCDALVNGLLDSGVNVFHIGECGTEEIYFATFHEKMDGGIVVTASHNPMDYNGMKFVREDSKPISGDTGLNEIQHFAEQGEFCVVEGKGVLKSLDTRPAYIKHLLTYVNLPKLKPLKIVVNAGNGGAGAVIDAIEQYLPFTFIKVHHAPDGNFPHGVPNPLLVENRESTRAAVIEHNADMGIAWDGDFDRCFFFDQKGDFIEGYYLVGLLAEAFLKRSGVAEKIVHDPRLTWNTQAIVEDLGGQSVECKTGHAFIKERMRAEDAVYGGEMSAHHYFKDFAYCDSGMIPWLLVAQLVSDAKAGLSGLVEECTRQFPVSGEINNIIEDPAGALVAIADHYRGAALEESYVDGLSMSFAQWRFNLRSSNTEPVVRLNVESRADVALMEEKRDELLTLLGVQ